MTKKQIRLLRALNFSILDFFMRKKPEVTPEIKQSTRTKKVTYKGIKWDNVKPLQDTSSFKQVEKLLGVKLPKELQNLIINCNGGEPTPAIFDTKRTMGHVFQALFSYNPNDAMNIFSVIENDNFYKKNKIIPIGDSANGDTICINRKGEVFCLDHEIMKYDDKDIIAPSIDLLLEDAGLYDSDDYIKHYKKYLTMCYDSISFTMMPYMGEYELMVPPHSNTDKYGSWLRALYNRLRDIMNILPMTFDRCNNNSYKNAQRWYKEHMNTFKLPPDSNVNMYKPHISFSLEDELFIVITYYIADTAGKGATKRSFKYDLEGNLTDETVETKKQPK